MTSLIACLSTGKGTWAQLIKLINEQNWERIILITNNFGKEKFSCQKKVEFVVIDPEKPINEIVKTIKPGISGITDLEVALNLTSGTGKEHMAILSAVISSGLGFRLVECSETGLIEL
ncbi:MAG: hypothetical protein QXK37_03105 [Candidatus Woesearchaeota archaeon]